MSYLQYCNIRQFDMVTNPGQLHCFCMGHIFSKYHTGKKRNYRKFNIVKHFCYSILVLLKQFIKEKQIFSIGVVMAIVSIVFLWIIAAVFNRIGKTRKFIALGIIFLLAIPFIFIVNVMLSKMIAEPILDIWDILSIFILLILAFVSFICDYAKKKGLIK